MCARHLGTHYGLCYLGLEACSALCVKYESRSLHRPVTEQSGQELLFFSENRRQADDTYQFNARFAVPDVRFSWDIRSHCQERLAG